MVKILGPDGEPIATRNRDPRIEIGKLRSELQMWQARANTLARSNGIQARYDAAAHDDYSQRHWANSDFLSPDSANDHGVRRRLRSRSRYEVIENNSYLKGMSLSMANDFTGSGPKIVVTDKRFTKQMRKQIAFKFMQWSRAICLREKVWRMRVARFVDGEAFGLQFTNQKCRHPVKVDWWLFEPDQCGYGYSGAMIDRERRWRYIDGVRFNRYQQVQDYYILNMHPGGRYLQWTEEDLSTYGEWVPEEFVLHWFRKERGWMRGIPETTPALPLCAILRRYTLAVLHAAETSADFAGVLQTTAPPFQSNWINTPTGSTDDYESFDTFPIDKGMFTTVPYGYELSQLRAEQPTTVYDKFVDAILREISRCLMIPFNIASGFSGGYNFASGTLDRKMYQSSINRDHDSFEDVILQKMLRAWWEEAVLNPDYLGAGMNIYYDDPPDVQWVWDDNIQEHMDPVKVAQATKIWWDLGAVTDEDLQRKLYNRDIDEHYESLEEQNDRRREMGMNTPGVLTQQVVESPGEGEEGETEDATSETEEE